MPKGPKGEKRPANVESPAALEQRLTDALLAFERLDEEWPKRTNAVERAVIAGVTAEDNGRFFNYDGEALPW